MLSDYLKHSGIISTSLPAVMLAKPFVLIQTFLLEIKKSHHGRCILLNKLFEFAQVWETRDQPLIFWKGGLTTDSPKPILLCPSRDKVGPTSMAWAALACSRALVPTFGVSVPIVFAVSILPLWNRMQNTEGDAGKQDVCARLSCTLFCF